LAREFASVTLAALADVDAAIETGDYRPEMPHHRERTKRHGKRG
jgi:hypothetical protein